MNARNLFSSRLSTIATPRGFTLVELLIVIFVIGVLAMMALPSFISAYQKTRFTAVVQEVRGLVEEARTQALASQYTLITRGGVTIPTIPAGGYGVFIDRAAKEAVLFIDDWNATTNTLVDMGYDPASIANRTVPDRVYTVGKDTRLRAVRLEPQTYITTQPLTGTTLAGAAWQPTVADAATATLVFQPPYADTTIDGRLSTGTTTALQQFTLTFTLQGRTSLTRSLIVDRITTTPLIR